MSPLPLVLGLTLCENAIVEERTKNLTLLSTFTKMAGTAQDTSYRKGTMTMDTPQTPLPRNDHGATTESLDSLLFVFDGPGDTTRRPARPNLPPPYWPGREPPPGPPKAPNDQPPAQDKT
jgi:hypothetical protein